MFRIVLRALLTVFCALLFNQCNSAGTDRPYLKRKPSTKTQMMSNVSMVIYWALDKFLPIEMVPDAEEWLKIDGSEEDHKDAEEYDEDQDESSL